MKTMWPRLICALALAAVLVHSCPAQDYGWRGEVYGTAGLGKTWDDEGSLGSGFNGGGGVGYRISPRFGAELDVNAFRHERAFGSTHGFRGKGVFTTGNLLYYFTRGRGEGYLVGGIGALRYTNSSWFGPPQPERSGTGFAVNFGVGVKAFLTRHLSLRPEFRIYGGSAGRTEVVEPPFTAMRVSIGLGYHW